MTSKLLLRIKELMAEVFELPLSSIGDSITIEDVDRWDSARHVQLMVALEDAFGVKIPDEEMIKLISLPAILAAISHKVSKV